MFLVKSLLGFENAGFEIINQGEKAVVGRRIKQHDLLDNYVVWNYHIEENGEPRFYWGRYIKELEDTTSVFLEKSK